MTDDDVGPKRRRLLGAIAVALAGSTAGCSGEIAGIEFSFGESDDGSTPTPTQVGYGGTPTTTGSTATAADRTDTPSPTETTPAPTPTKTPDDDYGRLGYGQHGYGG